LSDEQGQRAALTAVVLLLPAMQGSARELCRELIPFVLDWSDRYRVWARLTEAREALLAMGRMHDAKSVLARLLPTEEL
jgi:hypothetical protein